MSISMRQMLDAGVHFGHQTRYWNPKMAEYIFGDRNRIHIINLEKTLPMFLDAQQYVRTLAANKGRILFVGTKRAARDIIQEEAMRAGCTFINYRWLGGLLTNFRTVKQSVKRLTDIETMLTDGSIEKFSKKEALGIQREYAKLNRSLGGIKAMNVLPDAIFIIDVRHESGAITEATKLGIPVIGVVDSNNSPENVQYIIPGNDDSSRAIRLYARGIADAVLEGRSAALEEMVKHAQEDHEIVATEVDVAIPLAYDGS